MLMHAKSILLPALEEVFSIKKLKPKSSATVPIKNKAKETSADNSYLIIEFPFQEMFPDTDHGVFRATTTNLPLSS